MNLKNVLLLALISTGLGVPLSAWSEGVITAASKALSNGTDIDEGNPQTAPETGTAQNLRPEPPMIATSGADAAAAFTVADLIGQPVSSASGRTIGEIDNIVTIRGETMVILGVGGFLGLGEHDVAVPVTELTLRNDQVTAMGYTRAQLKTMRAVRYGIVRPLDLDAPVRLNQS